MKPKTLLARTSSQVKDVAAQLRVATKQAFAAVPATTSPATPDGGGSTGELWLYGIVGGWWSGFNADGVAAALRGMDVDSLTVRIHSPGGLASDGIAISNLLRNYDAEVTVVVDGVAASAASVIALAGDQIVMCPGSQMMIHDASTGGWGNAAELHRAADWIDGQSQNYAGIYALKAGGTADDWRKVMTANDGDGTWYTADAAVAAGLADEVGTRIAMGSPPVLDPDMADLEDDEEMLARAAHDVELFDHHVHSAARAAWLGERSKPPVAPAAGNTKTEGGSAVAFSDEQIAGLRDTFSLPEDATEDQILAAATEAMEKATAPVKNATKIPEGHVVIPEARLSDLETIAKKSGEELARLKADAHETAREAFLDANKTKFAAENRDKWAKNFDRDPEGTAALFADADDLVPTAFEGHADDGDGESEGAVTRDELAKVRESKAYKNWSM